MACFLLPPSGNAVPAFSFLNSGRGFASEFSSHCGFPESRVLFTGSGTSALFTAMLGLRALRPAGRRVAVPAWCCPSVPQAVLQAGLEPVPVDLDPCSLGYDLASLRSARERGLAAILLVHFFGAPQPRPPGDWGDALFLRDCAQDFEHRCDPGDDIPCFYSFGRGKALNAGHGGALCFPGECPWLRTCRVALSGLPPSGARPLPKALAINWFSRPRIFWALARLPFLAIGRTVWETRLECSGLAPGFFPVGSASLRAYLARRPFYADLVGEYRAVFSACDGDWLAVPGGPGPAGRLPVRYPVLVRDPELRERLLAEMNGRFGGVTRQYPAVLTALPGAPAGLGRGARFPGAERVAREILTFPITAELRGREKAFLDCLAGTLKRAGVLRRRGSRAFTHPSSLPSVP